MSLRYKSDHNMYQNMAKITLNRNLAKHVYGLSTSPRMLTNLVSNEQNLPKLPVPVLKNTLDKYLQTVRPFLDEKEFNVTANIIKKFSQPDGVGMKLQKMLIEKAKHCDNWLADWWLNIAYLGYRDSVVVFSSPGLVFPMQNFKDESDRLTYTANMIAGAVDYKVLIDTKKIPLDKMGKDPLDMQQYQKVFGTCRVPGVKIDSLEYYPNSKHITVVHKNQFFKMDVYGQNGEVLSINQLLAQLTDIITQSQTAKTEGVGILSSDNRDNWAHAYQNLITDPINKQSVKEIQTSLFVVSLDEAPTTKAINRQTLASQQLIHGGGSASNGANRWFDKTVQFVIGKDGINGLTYEHSPAEGQPIAVMTDHVVNFIVKKQGGNIPDASFNGRPERLNFYITPAIQKDISKAKENLDKLVANLDMDCTTFKSFGKEFVKSQKLSPDSFIQIAMQFAFYRLHKVPAAHYESAATRKYVHGRTETIRSCSMESVAFASSMMDNHTSDQDRVKALRDAINAHRKYTLEAVNGYGVDRHLLGLKLIAQENKIELPPLYSDLSYSRSTHMRISSSQVATKCDGFMCYGPLVPDGYGCCYNPRKNDINIAVSAFQAHPDTKASNFREAMEKSLEDMHDLLLKTQKSKL